MFRGRLVFARMVLLGLLGLGGVVQAAPQRYAFGVNGEDFSLSTYRVEADGRLRHLGHRPIDKAPSQVVLDPSGRFVLAVSNTSDNLMVFRLDPPSGGLQPVPGSPFATGTRSPFSIAFHPSGRFVYLGVRFGGVGAFRFDPHSGAISPIAGSPFPAQRRTRAVVVHPSGRFLYAVNAYSNSVSAYRINEQSGALKQLPGSPYTVGDFGVIDYLTMQMGDVPAEAGGIPIAIAMDPGGHFLFVANKAAASVSVFAIDPHDGGLRQVPGSPFFTGFNPYRIKVHPSGRFLFVTLWSTGQVAVQAIDPRTGRLTAVQGSPFAVDSDTPVDIAFNAGGTQAYVSNYDGNDITLFDVDTASGAMTLKERVKTRSGPWSLALTTNTAAAMPAMPEVYAARGKDGLAQLVADKSGLQPRHAVATPGVATAVAVAPNGRFAYALDGPQASLATFAVAADSGDLALVPGGVVPTGRQPSDMAIDVNGWYLYVTNAADRTLSVYYLDPKSGIPRPVRGSPFATGRHPVAVTLDPAARYAFVVNRDAENISVYRYMNSVTPLIFEARKYGSPFATGKEPMALAVEPTGKYAYVANAGSNDISAYRIQRKTGALSALPGSPFKAGKRPVALAVHPNGRWLLVADHDAADIGVYGIEPNLGALVPVSHVGLPLPPQALWLDGAGKTLYVLAEGGRRLFTYVLDAGSGTLTAVSEQRLTSPIRALRFSAN
jgi:6-phosphogluconolactonase